MRQVAAVALLLIAGAAAAEPKRTVLVTEYRAGARGGVGLGEHLARLLAANAAFEVIDPQEARRRAGARIDADVARCGGDAACVAALGERLGANEVLLVGVSQLGDVVLSFQRIDVKRGAAGARLAESLPPDARPGDEQMLGWLRQLYPPEAFRRYAAIQVLADVPGAQVSLNGEARGRTPLAEALSVRAPATYRVRVEKSGYVSFQARIDVLPDAAVEVRATLVRESTPTPWYKRWYVWAAVGAVAAAAGAGVAIYYGTRVDETPQGFITLQPR
jgi:hypothetical protein